MGQSWRWGMALAAASCHAGAPFDLDGVVVDPGPAASDPVVVVSSLGSSGGARAAVQRDAGMVPDAGTPDASDSDLSRSIEPSQAALGAVCGADGECASTHCSTGHCCNRVCGDCEACASEGRCVQLAECKFAVCDAGLCQAARGPLGAACGDGGECGSGFCANGVCCEGSCDGVCQQCNAAGFCNLFPALDSDCADVICPEDTACRTYVAVSSRACTAFGRCATPEDCLVRNSPLGLTCDAAGARCDGHGVCQTGATFPVFEPTQICPQVGGGPLEVRLDLDGGLDGCWVGPTWEAGITVALGSIETGPLGPGSVTLGVYLLGTAASAKTQAFDAAGVLLPGCVVVDASVDQTWTYATFNGETCRNAAFARLTAHSSDNGDL